MINALSYQRQEHFEDIKMVVRSSNSRRTVNTMAKEGQHSKYWSTKYYTEIIKSRYQS